MNQTTRTNAPAAPDSAAWDDVLDVAGTLGSTLDPGPCLEAVGKVLRARTGAPVEVFAVDRDKGQLRDYSDRPPRPLHPGLAAALQLHTGAVALEGAWWPGEGPRSALGLRDGDVVTGIAFVGAALPAGPDPALPAIAALCGAAIARAARFDRLARLTGDSEHTRSLQQQILDHVSHEFNTPLMILRSSSDFAREASSDEERELFFDMHAQALERLEELVRGVIEVAHASARGKRERLQIEDVVSRLVLPHFVDAEWPDEVPALWHRADPVEIEIEPESLELALEHLLHNARDHAATEGAHVAVAIFAGPHAAPGRGLDPALAALQSGETSLPPSPADADTLWIEVIDSGRGIPQAELGVIFEPFTQASNSPLRGVSGAGMGLATASRLVEAAGGRIEVESALGRGSIFRIALPAA